MKVITQTKHKLSTLPAVVGTVYVGIDQSMTSTGVAVLEDGVISVYRIKTDTKDGSSYARISFIWKTLKRLLKENHAKFDQEFVFCIEGYSMGSKGSRVYTLGELGGYLRLQLLRTYKTPLLEVPPSTFKKFFTGHGGADKSKVVETLRDKYQLIITNHDEADAAGLCISAYKYDNCESNFTKDELKAMESFSIIPRLPPDVL